MELKKDHFGWFGRVIQYVNTRILKEEDEKKRLREKMKR